MSQNQFDGSTEMKRNGVAMWAMILGIAALVLSLVVVGGLLGLLAGVLGIVGIIKPGRKGMAITGLVTGIMALPVAFVALFFWIGFLAIYYGNAELAKEREAVAMVSQIKTALEVYEVDCGAYPSSEQGLQVLGVRPAGATQWHGPYLDSPPLDPWGRPFMYKGPEVEDGDFNVISAGTDGKFDTDDDIDIHQKFSR